DPDPDKLLDLKLFIKQFGYELDLRNHDTVTKSMNDLLQEIQGKPEQNLIETLAIRTMSKAKYSTDNDVGHYGLAFKNYSHFRSDPDPDKLLDLKLLIKQFGYELDLRNHDTVTKTMNDLLQEIQGKPEQNLIETLAIRTMSKAKYSTENDVGHYGLAFKYYSHF